MTFLEHLDELRKRITHAVVALLVGFLVAFAFIDRIMDFVYARLTADIPGRHADLHRARRSVLHLHQDGGDCRAADRRRRT